MAAVVATAMTTALKAVTTTMSSSPPNPVDFPTPSRTDMFAVAGPPSSRPPMRTARSRRTTRPASDPAMTTIPTPCPLRRRSTSRVMLRRRPRKLPRPGHDLQTWHRIHASPDEHHNHTPVFSMARKMYHPLTHSPRQPKKPGALQKTDSVALQPTSPTVSCCSRCNGQATEI